MIESIEEEIIDIRITGDTYLRSIIEEIGAKNSLELVNDWAIFLKIDNQLIYAPPD